MPFEIIIFIKFKSKGTISYIFANSLDIMAFITSGVFPQFVSPIFLIFQEFPENLPTVVTFYLYSKKSQNSHSKN